MYIMQGNDAEDINEQISFKCRICNGVFDSNMGLIAHQRVHKKIRFQQSQHSSSIQRRTDLTNDL